MSKNVVYIIDLLSLISSTGDCWLYGLNVCGWGHDLVLCYLCFIRFIVKLFEGSRYFIVKFLGITCEESCYVL